MPQLLLPRAGTTASSTNASSSTSFCRRCRSCCIFFFFVVVLIQLARLIDVSTTSVPVNSRIIIPRDYNSDSGHNDNDGGESSTALARYESLGFMTDVPDKEWRLLKKKVHEMYPNVKGGNISVWLDQTIPISAGTFFQEHFEPNFVCHHERRLGLLGDGGKWVCDPHRLPTTPSSSCLIYSIGSNGEASFEEALHRIAPQCEIHTFDPEPHYQRVVERASGGYFHAWGIAHQATTNNPLDNHVYKTLDVTMAELGHTGRTIDILKIDCEGCEWTIAPSLLAVDVRQILIELHSIRDESGRNDHRMPMPTTMHFFDNMHRHGYVIFHKEANIQYWDYRSCIEYGFIKLHRDFFLLNPAESSSSVEGYERKR